MVAIPKPRENDNWIMLIFVENGYKGVELARLNRVRLHQQVLFLSDVLDSSGRILEKKYLQKRDGADKWSAFVFPKQSPSRKDFNLWRQALQGVRGRQVGQFRHSSHKQWSWRYVEDRQIVLHRTGENTMDIYHPTEVPRYAGRPNCWTRARVDQDWIEQGDICTVTEIATAVWRSSASVAPPQQPVAPLTLLGQLAHWGNGWLWEDIEITGDGLWLRESILRGSCIAVADGSYMKEAHPHCCSTAFILECQEGCGHIRGSFAEFSAVASAFRGELLGLMAIHLILRALREVSGELSGKIRVYSDCKGALSKVRWLPPQRIAASSRHADILRIILQARSKVEDICIFKYVQAHQDDAVGFYVLGRPAQLNCLMDASAKRELLTALANGSVTQRQFPTEAAACFVGARKVTSDAVGDIKFWAHRRLARESLCTPTKRANSILTTVQFDEIAWEFIAKALQEVPRMFQLWACKQVWDIAGTNSLRAKWDNTVSPRCPSCKRWNETSGHILICREKGRATFWQASVDLLDKWLKDTNTDPIIRHAVVSFARERGRRTMSEIIRNMDAEEHHSTMAHAQDVIGWRRLMEGMISQSIVISQDIYRARQDEGWETGRWATGLVTKLLEVTHGQWLYRNLVVHEARTGVLRTEQKEAIQREIDKQLEMGNGDLLEEDQYLTEINLGDMEQDDGERHEYWLLAIQAARRAKELTAAANTVEEIDTG